MKYKILVYMNTIQSLIKTSKFKTIFLIIILFNLYAVITLPQDLSYIDNLILIFTDTYYVLFLILTLFFNTIYISEMFEKNSMYIMRFKNKKEYLKNLLSIIVIGNFILFIINCIVLLIPLNLLVGIDFKILKFMDYNITNTIYFMFYITRFFILMSMWMIISILIVKIASYKTSLLLNLILCAAQIFSSYNLSIIKNISSIKLGIYDYFRVYNYESFNVELLFSGIYLFFISLCVYILFQFSKNKIRSIEI